jgi:hypothetical protein
MNRKDIMKYKITVNVKGSVVVDVDAPNIKAAKAKIGAEMKKKNFGDLKNTQWNAICAESETGNSQIF